MTRDELSDQYFDWMYQLAQIIKKVVFESHASDIYLIVEEGFYKRTLDIHGHRPGKRSACGGS